MHTKKLDTTLNTTCRKITGCLRPTNVKYLYTLSGINQPEERRKYISSVERKKQECDNKHMLFDQKPPRKRLKSRNSFLDSTSPNQLHPRPPTISGCELAWPEWLCLNRLRSGVGRCKVNMAKWGYTDQHDILCECGEVETMEHILVCGDMCTAEDLQAVNETAMAKIQRWTGRI